MTVSELIEYLKTLEQDYIVEVGDSEYPNTEIDTSNFEENAVSKKYIIY